MITCQQYDYVEIACLYHLNLEFTLISGEKLTGKAITTQYNELKEECLVFETADKKKHLLVLNHLKSMRSLDDNKHFTEITFDQIASGI